MIDEVAVVASSLLARIAIDVAKELKGKLPQQPKTEPEIRRLNPEQEKLVRDVITMVAREVFASAGLGRAFDAIVDAAVERVKSDPTVLTSPDPGAMTGTLSVSFEGGGELQAALKATKKPFKLSKRSRNAIGAILIQIAGSAPGTVGGAVGGAYLGAHLARPPIEQQVSITLQIAGNDVNVRPQPSMDNSPLTTLDNGFYVTQVEDAGEWVHIRIDNPESPHHGLVGYVSKQYLRPSL
jgi:hypothetical protein